MKYKIKVLSVYEKGHYRETQEDAIFPSYNSATADSRLFMVCDGMGGHEAGEVASQTVCEAMSRFIGKRSPMEEVLTDEVLNQALTEAYDLLDQRDPHPELEKKMGTTMTLLKLHKEGATIAHIGDSRVYQFRSDADGKMQVIYKTRDHSLVNDLLKVGELTPEEAENFPQKNVITRAMQSHLERRHKADIAHIGEVKAGDFFLLCSDGMLEHTSDQNLCYLIGKADADDETKIQMLRETTEDNRDNHSAYFIHILDVEQPVEKKTSRIRQWAAVVTAILVFLGIWLYFSNKTKEEPENQITTPLSEARDTIEGQHQ